jgi:hypothetical protein
MKREYLISIFFLIFFQMISNLSYGEGTAQLGAGQALREHTIIKVDILQEGEVINISAGNMETGADIRVIILTPQGIQNEFVIEAEGDSPGFLNLPPLSAIPQTISNPLRITTSQTGEYLIQLINTADGNEVTKCPETTPTNPYPRECHLAPFDITVTPTAQSPVYPYSPPLGYGRVHSELWLISAGSYTLFCDADFYVLVPGNTPEKDYTWLLDFEGLGGYIFLILGNSIGVDPPNSGFSIPWPSTNQSFPIKPEFEVYLNVPEIAQGGMETPSISKFEFVSGKQDKCSILVPDSLPGRFRFETKNARTYQIIIDTNQDGSFDPSQGDVLLSGNVSQQNTTVEWDGKDNNNENVLPGTYKVRISVRIGEFHFVAYDVETANPGLRVFRIEPPEPNTSPFPTKMYWNDTKVNQGYCPGPYCIQPESTLPDGVMSDEYYHGWRFNLETGKGPGNEALIDTYVFGGEAILETTVTIVDSLLDEDNDGLPSWRECILGTNPNDLDTDKDGLEDGEEDKNKNGKLDPNETNPNDPDTDKDGILDGTEIQGENPTDPLKEDTDKDGLKDGEEDENKDGTLDPNETDPNDPDTDKDEILDGTEIQGGNPTNPLEEDTDKDGLKDGEEDKNKNGSLDPNETNPNDPDTDKGGVPDGKEVQDHNTDPLDPSDDHGRDFDGDGILNEKEKELGTDPKEPDTDKDGIPDGTEIQGENPTNPLEKDTDKDGLKDGEEDKNKDGNRDPNETDPNDPDTDKDEILDGTEIQGENPTDPLKEDTDKDGLKDGEEDKNKDGELDQEETNPNEPDTDKGGVPDGKEVQDHNTDPLDPSDDHGRDFDGDGILNEKEKEVGTDPKEPDTDKDGIPDGTEIQGKNPTDPLKEDTDKDGLKDGEEDKNKDGELDQEETNPNEPDTDKGGVSDGKEIERGSDPLNPSDDFPLKRDELKKDAGIDEKGGEEAKEVFPPPPVPKGCTCDSYRLADSASSWLFFMLILIGVIILRPGFSFLFLLKKSNKRSN